MTRENRGRATELLLFLIAGSVIAATGCKRSVTTRSPAGSGPGNVTKDDVDPAPVTVLPDGGVSGTADAGPRRRADVDAGSDAGSPRPDGRSTDEEADVWVPERGDFVLRDRQTGSWWNLRGEAYRGPMKGETLTRVPAFNSFWFAWSVFYHGSEIWQRGGENLRNTPGEIEGDDNCAVPCKDIEMGCPSKDCIPALDYDGRAFAGSERPKPAQMVEPGAAGTGYLDDSTFVFGVVVDGEARAYPHNIYWWHEIHNDEIGDREVAVTFCPLTGSGIVFDGRHDGDPIRFGVSGRLYNSNLIMFDPGTDTFWSQMLGEGIKGEQMGEQLDRLPVVETTWERWKEMYPETLVTSSETGYNRNYDGYPYGDYRTDDGDTFGADAHQPTYEAKDRVLGLPGDSKRESLAFALPELAGLPGDRNVVHATFDGEPLIVVYEAEHRMAIPFRATVDGRPLTFVGRRSLGGRPE